MLNYPSKREVIFRLKKIVTLVIIVLLAIPVSVAFGSSKHHDDAPNASVVLVHGAWADGSSWNGVIARLQDQGYTVYTPPNPLRGLASDSAYLASFLNTLTGPIILVGHSYGGAVITNAAAGNTNVKALVFIDAFAPDQGESLQSLSSVPPPPGQTASCLAGDPTQLFNFVPIPNTQDVDLYIKQSIFPSCFANDLLMEKASFLASTARPLAFSTFSDESGLPAWKTIPSWYLVGTIDKVIPPFAQLFMAQRINAHISMVRGSHLVMISHPGVVIDLIDQANQSIQGDSSDSQQTLAPITV